MQQQKPANLRCVFFNRGRNLRIKEVAEKFCYRVKKYRYRIKNHRNNGALSK